MKRVLLIVLATMSVFMSNRTNAQTYEEMDPDTGRPLLVGEYRFHELRGFPEFEFDRREADYHPEPELMETIHLGLQKVEVKIFFGNWCEDSRELLPKLYQLFAMSGYPPDELVLYALDKDKKSKTGIEKEYKIKFVPTIIFFHADKEIGRITERPEGTLEKNVYDILSKLLQDSEEGVSADE